MNVIVAIVLAAAGLIAGGWVIWASRTESARQIAGTIDDEAWARAEAAGDGIDRVLLKLGRPFAGLGGAIDSDGRLHQHIETRLLAAGGAYGSDPEIFFAAQAVAVLFAAGAAVLGALNIIPVALTAFAIPILIMFPYGRVDSRAKSRARAVNSALPDFAELLQMPLSAGQGIDDSLEYTAQQSQGPVAEEVHNMLRMIRTRAYSESDSYKFAGRRLGTPAAEAFFAVLLSAKIEGTEVVASLENQAVSLREAWYQQRRAEIKQLPVKMILIFGLFFMPVLMLFALLPAVLSMGNI
jgi:Flp pilus assembly protein TadB